MAALVALPPPCRADSGAVRPTAGHPRCRAVVGPDGCPPRRPRTLARNGPHGPGPPGWAGQIDGRVAAPLLILVPVRASSVRVVLARLCFQALVSPSYVTVPLRSLPPLLPDPPPAGIFVCTALNKVLLLPAVAADSAFGRSVHESSAAEAAVRHPSRSRDARAGLGDSAGGYGRV